jgi:NitT/TauT family transport system substrate-binding protein
MAVLETPSGTPVNRRVAIASTAATFAAVCLSGPSMVGSAPSPAKVRVLRATVETTMGPQYALELGLFQKYGLDVTIETVHSGEAATTAVLGGAAQIASSNVLAIVVAHAKGIPVRLFAPGALYVPNAPTVGLVVAKGSVLSSAADLQGRTIAVSGLRDIGTLAIMAWLQKNGADPKSVRFIEIPDALKAAAVARGTVDGAQIGSPWLEASLETCRVLTVPLAAVANSFLINGWFAQTDWLDANRDVAGRFSRAVVDAQIWANDDRAKSAKILAAFSNVDAATIAKMARVTFGSRLDAALVQPVVNIAAQFGMITAPFPAIEMLAPV